MGIVDNFMMNIKIIIIEDRDKEKSKFMEKEEEVEVKAEVEVDFREEVLMEKTKAQSIKVKKDIEKNIGPQK